ncbi:MAG: adenylate/guanylate cyclase domain-containing protein [Noviherbaspirillum sp.]
MKQLNRTFIGSVLFIDIVGYSMRTVPDQLEMKELFNSMLSDAVQNVAPGDRIMVDTGDGAGIAFLGDPEDALFAALSLRDAIDSGKIPVGEPGFVRMGINLGPLNIVRDINGHTNMIGDAVNDAQRVMSFAEPGQVMVSHSYYDIISRFSRDYNQLFVYEGAAAKKHQAATKTADAKKADETKNAAAVKVPTK